MSVLLGKTPRMHRNVESEAPLKMKSNLDVDLKEVIHDILRHPTVCQQKFLITIGDRGCRRIDLQGPDGRSMAGSGSRCCRYSPRLPHLQRVKRWQWEKTPLAISNAAAVSRMAIGEALTNLVSADIDLDRIILSANWMGACGQPGQDASLFAGVEAASTFSKS